MTAETENLVLELLRGLWAAMDGSRRGREDHQPRIAALEGARA